MSGERSGVRLEARGLVKSYQDGQRVVEVLRGVDLDVGAGELVAVVGPSGCGKSTLLHVLGTLDRADAGEVRIGERDVSDLLTARRAAGELAAFRNQTIGFVFQFHQLLPDFTALENVMLPARIAGRPASQAEEAARRLLDEVGLSERLDHYPSQLSGGERQRVALCRALSLEPPLLLADEPTGNLDAATGERVLEQLVALQRRHGTTAVLVTHNPEIARRCARVLVLQDGILQPSSG